MSTTDQQLLSQVQAVVIEPPDGGASYPSGLWTVAEVLDSLNDRQNLLLKLTGLRRTRATLTTVPNNPRQTLPSDWIVTIRAAWERPDGTITALPRGDMLEVDLARRDWAYTPTPLPFIWTDGELPTRQINFAPAASDAGLLRLLYVACGTVLAGTGTVLSVPDECVPTVKYGVLADMLLKPGRSFDPARAAYCEARFAHGVQAVVTLLRSFL